ncbi:hypothetical protein EJB05_44279, partial [Eragrostis curvula]
MSNLARVVGCNSYRQQLREQAIEILAELALDVPVNMSRKIIATLRHLFLDGRSNSSDTSQVEEVDSKTVRRKAGEALVRLLSNRTARASTSIAIQAMLLGHDESTDAVVNRGQSGSNLVTRLSDMLEDKVCQVSAAEIIEQLCLHFTKYHQLPKQVATNLLAKVVNQILSVKTRANDTAIMESGNNNHVAENDVESQPPKDADRNQSSIQQNYDQSEERRFLTALLSLALLICNKLTDADDFSCAVTEDAALVKKLLEIIYMNNFLTADCLRIMKLTCQMLKAMVQLKPSCIKYIREYNFMEALCNISKSMSDLDKSMLFNGDYHWTTKSARSLASLVKEVQDELSKSQEQELVKVLEKLEEKEICFLVS